MELRCNSNEVRLSCLLVRALAFWFCVVALLVLSGSAVAVNTDDSISGYGYVVEWAGYAGGTGRSLTALLRLITESPEYGPDIQLLNLTARTNRNSFPFAAWKPTTVSASTSPTPTTPDGKSPNPSSTAPPSPPPLSPLSPPQPPPQPPFPSPSP
ncbi:Alpha-glucosidase-like protein [Drosera capensis]